MPDEQEQTTEELKALQLERETTEHRLAQDAPDSEAAQHERRAEKAAYLREKLEDRERSEKQARSEEEQEH